MAYAEKKSTGLLEEMEDNKGYWQLMEQSQKETKYMYELIKSELLNFFSDWIKKRGTEWQSRGKNEL